MWAVVFLLVAGAVAVTGVLALLWFLHEGV
jgi:hypothetical protein